MERIWMVVAPTQRETRILATSGPGDTLLKARLSSRIQHPRALPTLLEALALWQGQKVHAVLAVGDICPSFEANGWLDLGGHGDTPLYSLDLELVPSHRRRRRLDGLGSFGDLHRLLATEVAR